MFTENFNQFQKFLFERIPKEIKQKFPGSLGLERTKYLLKLLARPQNRLKVIHVAGTSGKGSTAYLTSALLKDHCFKVGLHLSPHLLDLRERFQINNQFLKEERICFYFNQIYPAIIKCGKTKFGLPTYFEILTALAFYIFHQEKVDYAVIETGLGGRYDATNCVDRKDKLVVLTKIGLDHTAILGKTIGKIALNKAMIIQEANQVISIRQKPAAERIIEKVAREKKTRPVYLSKNINFRNITTNIYGTKFDFTFSGENLKSLRLNLIGLHQAENCSLALASLMLLAERDGFAVEEKTIRKTFSGANFPGRLDIKKVGQKNLVIDGAHNPQKMKALINSLKKIFPDRQFSILLAFKKGKDYKKMIRLLLPVAKKIIITRFHLDNQDLIHLSEEPETIGLKIKKLGFNNYQIINNPKTALRQLLKEDNCCLLITGSLYLLSEVYPDLK